MGFWANFGFNFAQILCFFALVSFVLIFTSFFIRVNYDQFSLQSGPRKQFSANFFQFFRKCTFLTHFYAFYKNFAVFSQNIDFFTFFIKGNFVCREKSCRL